MDLSVKQHTLFVTKVSSSPTGEVTSLEHKIKKLQKHQAFCAEVAANEASLRELRALCEELGQPGPRRQLAALSADWDRLLQATQEKGTRVRCPLELSVCSPDREFSYFLPQSDPFNFTVLQ